MPDLPKYTAGVRAARLAPAASETTPAEPAETAAPETAADEEGGFDFDEAVEEARAHLERMRLAGTDADDALLATPVEDSTLERRRRESLDAASRVEEAELALEKALRDQRLYGRGTVADVA
jgi:hypothetical protein